MLAEEIDLSRAVSEMQQSGWGPSEVEHLPAPNSTRKHRINEPLLVTDKEGIKNLTGKLDPLGDSRKQILSLWHGAGLFCAALVRAMWPTIRRRGTCPSLTDP
jgi:hypothetical protein